jgi:hypothetical protein
MTTSNINSKSFKALYNEAKKRSTNTLSSGVKTFARLYGNQAANAELLAFGVADRKWTKAQVKEFTEICKNKDLVFKICKSCAANIDGVIVSFTVQETIIKATGERDGKSEKWIKEKPLGGETFKPFGFHPETVALKGKPRYIVVENETYKRVSVSVECAKFSDTLIAKCIAAYLDLTDELKAKL